MLGGARILVTIAGLYVGDTGCGPSSRADDDGIRRHLCWRVAEFRGQYVCHKRGPPRLRVRPAGAANDRRRRGSGMRAAPPKGP
jgi:hypothetical protein